VDITTDLACEKDLTVKLYEPGTSNLVDEFSGTTDANGDFSISGVAPGEYDIYVKVDGYLQVLETATITAGDNSVSFGAPAAGDLDGDNTVGPLDLASLLAAYNTSSGDANFNESADFTCDGAVGPLDLSPLLGNYNLAGEEPPTE
jgi:hypothetical protein